MCSAYTGLEDTSSVGYVVFTLHAIVRTWKESTLLKRERLCDMYIDPPDCSAEADGRACVLQVVLCWM